MITIWNPLIQELVISEDKTNIKLAYHLVNDPRLIVEWYVHVSEDGSFGLPVLPPLSPVSWLAEKFIQGKRIQGHLYLKAAYYDYMESINSRTSAK